MPDTPHSPLEVLWRPPALIAVLMAAEALALVLALAPGAAGDRWVYFGLASLAAQWTVLPTLMAIYLLRRPLGRLSPVGLAWAGLGILLAMAALVAAAAWSLLRDVWDGNDPWGFALRLMGIALVVGLLGLIAFQNYWRARRDALRAKQSELEALQARIQPHFLFNTLNTGAALAHSRPDEAERVLLDLADLFRAALSGPRAIPLAEEIALTRRYLDIEALRFGQRLRVHWRLPEPLPDTSVPSLSLQPLAENAIRHGIEPLPAGGQIVIEAVETKDGVAITVRNPLPASPTASRGHRVGQDAARARIEAMGGTLETRIEDGQYIATMRLPAR